GEQEHQGRTRKKVFGAQRPENQCAQRSRDDCRPGPCRTHGQRPQAFTLPPDQKCGKERYDKTVRPVRVSSPVGHEVWENSVVQSAGQCRKRPRLTPDLPVRPTCWPRLRIAYRTVQNRCRGVLPVSKLPMIKESGPPALLMMLSSPAVI